MGYLFLIFNRFVRGQLSGQKVEDNNYGQFEGHFVFKILAILHLSHFFKILDIYQHFNQFLKVEHFLFKI